MGKKINRQILFIAGAIVAGVLVSLLFTFAINICFPQPAFFFGRSRFIAITIAVSSTICLVRYRRYFAQNLHKAFLLIALAFGVAFVLVFPRAVYLSPDDQIHFRNAYFFMEETVELRGGFSVIESAAFTNAADKGFDELSALYDTMDQADKTVVDAHYQANNSPELYNRLVYLPFYLGFKLSDLFHLNFTTSIVVAKLCNLFCYVLLVYSAIKNSGKFNRIFFIIGLLTCNLFLATQFSYDPLVIASLLLAISLFLHIRQTTGKASTRYLLGFVVAVTFGSLTKAIYCPLLLLVLMIPNDKFDCKRRAIVFKICAMLVMLVLASTFVLPILGGGLASDIRGGNTSVSGQIHFLLSNPLKAFAVVGIYLANQWPSLVFDPVMSFVSLGAVATAAPIYEICSPVVPLVGTLSLVVLLWATFKISLAGTGITKQSKIGFALIYLILLGAVTASMYLSFTAVGNLRVDGVQPRYLMPFFPLLLLLMTSSRSTHEQAADNHIVLFTPYICLALIFATYILRMSII